MNDFKQTLNMLRPFYRGLPIIAVVMFLSVAAAKKYLNYTTPMYESVVHIKLADAQVGIPHSNLYRDFDVFASANKIGAEVEMLKSQVVIEKALEHIDLTQTVYRVGEMNKTELYSDCPFKMKTRYIDPKVMDSVFSVVISNDSNLVITGPKGIKVSGKINFPIMTPFVEFYFFKNDSLFLKKPKLLLNDKYEFVLNSPKVLLKQIEEKIDVVTLDKEVPILRIAFKSASAVKSADIVNTLAEAYIKDYVEERYTAADTTVNFLNRELKNYNEKLSISEEEIETFKKKNNVVNIKQETETDLRKLSELRNHLSGLQMDLVAIDSLDKYITSGKDAFKDLAPNFQTFNDLLSTELIKKIKQLQADRLDLLLKYTKENEKVKVVDDKLNELYSYLQESIKNTRQNLQFKYDDLKKTIQESEEAFATYPYKDRKMTILDRNFSLNDQIYRFLREKQTDAEIARSASISFHRIISKGEIPTKPVSPNPGLLKVVAGFLGFLFGTLFIYLVHFLKGRVDNATNVEKSTDIPIIGGIPKIKSQTQYKEVFKKLSIDLELKKYLEKGSVIAINSFDRNEGKRKIAIGIAKFIPSLGKKVIIIDADKSIDSSANKDLTIIDLIQLTPEWQQPQALLSALKKLQNEFDVIIIKNFPQSTNAEALLLMSPATLNLVVLDSRRTKFNRVEKTDIQKEELGITTIQFIINREGYTPSVFFQVMEMVKIAFTFLKTRKIA